MRVHTSELDAWLAAYHSRGWPSLVKAMRELRILADEG